PARVDVRALREPPRLEAAFLELPRELAGRDRVLRGEHHDAVVHRDLLLVSAAPSIRYPVLHVPDRPNLDEAPLDQVEAAQGLAPDDGLHLGPRLRGGVLVV